MLSSHLAGGVKEGQKTASYNSNSHDTDFFLVIWSRNITLLRVVLRSLSLVISVQSHSILIWAAYFQVMLNPVLKFVKVVVVLCFVKKFCVQLHSAQKCVLEGNIILIASPEPSATWAVWWTQCFDKGFSPSTSDMPYLYNSTNAPYLCFIYQTSQQQTALLSKTCFFLPLKMKVTLSLGHMKQPKPWLSSKSCWQSKGKAAGFVKGDTIVLSVVTCK